MRKCECIKDSKWFKIDDSFEEPGSGGAFEFKEGEKYFYFDESANYWGKCYTVIHSPGFTMTFGESEQSSHKFLDFFKI